MKKILLTLVLAFSMLFAFTSETKAQGALTINAGYSWTNGMIGVEAQGPHWALGAGYLSAKWPLTGDPISSISGHITWYDSPYNYSGYYATFAYIGNGYRYEDSYGSRYSSAMTGLIIGYKISFGDFGIKGGLGWGFILDGNTMNGKRNVGTWEVAATYSFDYNKF